ncbi:MAG TPA: hypothetical protein PK299_14030 [Anaerolineales bacterium]|nr:hypothetical protein [Anaerolineales bacterium]
MVVQNIPLNGKLQRGTADFGKYPWQRMQFWGNDWVNGSHPVSATGSIIFEMVKIVLPF